MASLFIGVLPPILGVVPNRFGAHTPWTAMNSLGAAVVHLCAAYCFLLAVAVAERGAEGKLPRRRRYVAAGVGATAAAVAIEVGLYVLVPEFTPLVAGPALLGNAGYLLGRALWSAANFGLCGGLALAVYVRFRGARLARQAFNAMEMQRVAAGREVLASRLCAMRARIEPEFLLSTLQRVEATYERDFRSGDRMLDGLIAYLRAALPQLRCESSTLEQERALAESYLSIVQARMGSRLAYSIGIDPALGRLDFPPMVLLPLIDEALRCGLEPLPHGGSIIVDAEVEGARLRVRVTDDGLPRDATTSESGVVAAIEERLTCLYGSAGRLRLLPNLPQGVSACVEVPRADSRDRR